MFTTWGVSWPPKVQGQASQLRMSSASDFCFCRNKENGRINAPKVLISLTMMVYYPNTPP